jgi:hypothetical protein
MAMSLSRSTLFSTFRERAGIRPPPPILIIIIIITIILILIIIIIIIPSFSVFASDENAACCTRANMLQIQK